MALNDPIGKNYPNWVNGDGHQGLEHLNERDRQINISGVREPKAKRVQSADGDHRSEVKIARHGNGLDDFEDADEEVSDGGAEGHVDHGEGDREGPVVHFPVEYVLVEDDDGEAEEDPYGYVGVG